MTADQFRRLALDLPEATESSHVAHPDFRFQNRIFATLGYPDGRWGMVKLTPDQQAEVLRAAPKIFRPAAGGWGRSGSTVVLLAAVTPAVLHPILRMAYENVALKKKVRGGEGRSPVRKGASNR